MANNPLEWRFERGARRSTHAEFEQRMEIAPEKIEYVDGIFATDRQRTDVPCMLIENLGIDRVVRLGKVKDWKAAIAQREASQRGRF